MSNYVRIFQGNSAYHENVLIFCRKIVAYFDLSFYSVVNAQYLHTRIPIKPLSAQAFNSCPCISPNNAITGGSAF